MKVTNVEKKENSILAVFILSATINLTVDLTQYMITERTSYYGFYQYRKKTSLGTQLH